MSHVIKLSSLMVMTILVSRSFVAVAAGNTEAEVLRKIHAVNQMEIRVGKLGQDKGLSAQAKTFGNQLVKDHTAADAKVKDLAQSENVDLAAKDSAELKNASAKEAALIEKLNSANASDFDRVFATEMARGHREMIQSLEAHERELHGTKTAALIRELLPSLRKHESMAKSVQQAE